MQLCTAADVESQQPADKRIQPVAPQEPLRIEGDSRGVPTKATQSSDLNVLCRDLAGQLETRRKPGWQGSRAGFRCFHIGHTGDPLAGRNDMLSSWGGKARVSYCSQMLSELFLLFIGKRNL